MTMMARAEIEREDLCLCDWDETLRKGFMLREWVPFLIREMNLSAYFGDEFDRIFDDFLAKRIDYETLVNDAATSYASIVAGLSRTDVVRVAEQFASNDASIFPFVKHLIIHLSEIGAAAVIVSGSPFEVIHVFAKRLGIQHVFALQADFDEKNIFTGKVRENFGNAAEKAGCVARLARAHRIIAAFGDSSADIPLLRAAESRFLVCQSDTRRHEMEEMRRAIEFPITVIDPFQFQPSGIALNAS